jgi:hypothetical protein
MALTPLLTATPNDPPTYSQGMAETFSWVPVQGAGRPLYARATYLANASDISISLSAENLNVNLGDVENLLKSQLGQSGFDFIVGGQTASSGPYTTIQVVSACKIQAINATSTNVGALTAFELPVNFSFNGPINSITLGYGAVIVYKR